MKFIHTADIHWGMVPDSGKPWSMERAQAIKNTFTTIINLALEKEVDLLLIAGDLFHRQPVMNDLKEINYLFSTISKVRVVIIAGNHDYIHPNSALLSFEWCSNVSFLLDKELTSVYFEDIHTQVHGFSYHDYEITQPLFDGIDAPDDDRIHIFLGHGGDAKHIPFDKKLLGNTSFSYIALGHIHKPNILIENKMAFPGSPEPLDKTDTGKHGVLVGEINPQSKKVDSLHFITLNKTQYIPLAVHLTPSTTNAELAMKITKEIQNRGPEHIYRFRLLGFHHPDVEFDLHALVSRFHIMEIVNEAQPEYHYGELFAEHSDNMIGYLIQKIQKEDMTKLQKKALNYGLEALLHTKEERG